MDTSDVAFDCAIFMLYEVMSLRRPSLLGQMLMFRCQLLPVSNISDPREPFRFAGILCVFMESYDQASRQKSGAKRDPIEA